MDKGIGVIQGVVMMQFTMIFLKLLDFVTWSWFWVLTPVWLSGILMIIGGTLLFFLTDKVVDYIKDKFNKRKK